MGGPVDCHPVPNLILDDQHPQLLQLFSQIFHVIAYDPVIKFHIGPVIKDIQ